jgi:TPP-dependent trihydroxycyclohexane-1,2-dione (THcHDO) dehydratase
MRTRARPYNKGLRLDYFVCSHEMFDTPDVSVIPLSVDKSESSKVDSVEQKAVAGDADVEVVQSTASSSSSKKAKGSRKRSAAEVEKAVEVEVEVAVVKAETSTSHIVYPNPRDVKVVDSYVLADANDCSDHCPVVLVLQTRIPSV